MFYQILGITALILTAFMIGNFMGESRTAYERKSYVKERIKCQK
jgi:hypothetical protein